MRDRKRTYGQPAISQWLGRRKALRRFPPFFMNNSEYRSLLNNKKYETETEDTYGEGVGRVYESDEDPLDLYSPVEGKIEIKLR